MTGIGSTSGYQQISRNNQAINRGANQAGEATASKNQSSNIEGKSWSPIDTKSSLVPRKTEYGTTIGDVSLSDKAKEYYEKLKSKYHNLEFIAVSKDMKAQVQQNAASFGNANKMVVLIDEEKLERMATDEAFRKKYEGIIAMSSNKLTEAKNSLTSSGASVKNFGMKIEDDGKVSFFAVVEKSQKLQKERIEKKAAEKKEQQVKEKKKAEKENLEERRQKVDDKEYVKIEASSLEELMEKVQNYSYNSAAARVMTDAERMVGAHINFKG
ncbi:MAG: DUF6033 family protein [Acetatifactor sp.]|nr:DUF6033 family protein [Acetatifactor sp.]